MVRITIETEACCGTGYCVRVAPEIFELVDDKATVRADVDLETVDFARLKRAAGSCPWRAIEVEQD